MVICAIVFGKSEDSDFKFSQNMIDVAVTNTSQHFGGLMAPVMPTLPPFFFRPILHLCVSDENKTLIVQSPELIALLTEALLLDGGHVRAKQDAQTKAAIQQDAAECFLWLAQFLPGRELLAAAPAVMDALRAMTSEASTEEAKESAHGALMAIEGRTPVPEETVSQKHIMVRIFPHADDIVTCRCADASRLIVLIGFSNFAFVGSSIR